MGGMRLRWIGTALVATGCFFSEPADDRVPDATADATFDAADAAVEAAVCAPPPDAGDLPCDVSAVFQNRCQTCHTSPPQNGAPFPLLTYEDLTSTYSADLLRWQRVAQVIEPSSGLHMPPFTQPQLTQSDFDTLHAWFAACALAVPEGTGCDVGEGDAGDAGDASLD